MSYENVISMIINTRSILVISIEKIKIFGKSREIGKNPGKRDFLNDGNSRDFPGIFFPGREIGRSNLSAYNF